MTDGDRAEIPKWELPRGEIDRNAFFTNLVQTRTMKGAKTKESASGHSSTATSDVSVKTAASGGVFVRASSDTSVNTKFTGTSQDGKTDSETALADSEWEHQCRKREFYGQLFYVDQVVLVEQSALRVKDSQVLSQAHSVMMEDNQSSAVSVKSEVQVDAWFAKASSNVGVDKTEDDSHVGATSSASGSISKEKETIIEPALTVKFVVLKRLPGRPAPPQPSSTRKPKSTCDPTS